MNKHLKALQALKQLNLAKFHASLWVIHRKLHNRIATYDARFVKTDPKLQHKLNNIVAGTIRSANTVREYEFITADQEKDEALTLDVAETDLKEIDAQIEQNTSAPTITNPGELVGAWAYIIELRDGKDRVAALRKISDGWKLLQKEKALTVLFKDRVLIDFEEEEVFRLDRAVDCVAFNGLLFILDKKKFERALNFRDGMQKNVENVLTEFASLGLFTDLTVLKDTVGTKLPYLRRLSTIKKNGYYKQADYLERVREVCKSRGWQVRFKGKQMVITKDNVDLVLTLLNNDRLESPVNSELFDVLVKAKVSNS